MSINNPEQVQERNQETGPTLADWWRVLRRDRRFIIAITLIGTVLTMVYASVMPESYSAVSTVMPPEKESGGGLSSVLSGAGMGLDIGALGGSSEESKRFVDILKSRTLAEVVARHCNIGAYHQFSALRGQKQLEAFRGVLGQDLTSNGLVIVSADIKTPYFADDAERKAAAALAECVANQAVHVLDSMNKVKSVLTARKTRLYIERYMQQVERRLDSLQDAMEQFRQKHKILALEEQVQAVVENAVSIGRHIAEAEVELVIARSRMAPNTAIVQELEKQVQALKEQYYKIQEGGLVEQDAFSIPLNEVPELSRRYLGYVRDIKILEEINAFLETRRTQEAIQEERDVPTLHILDMAVAPENKSAPNKVLMTFFGLVLFGGLAITLVVVRALRRGALAERVEIL